MTLPGGDSAASTPSFPNGHSYTCVSDDADLHAGNLRGWSQLYDQLSSGSFYGALQGAYFGSVHLFRESTSARLRQSCMVQSDALWFGIPASDDAAFRMDTRAVGPGAIAVRRGRRAFELVTPNAFDIFGIVIDRARLQQHLQAEDQAGMLPRPCDVLPAGMEERQRLRHRVQAMLTALECRPEMLHNPVACNAMENALLDALAAVCSGGRKVEDTGRTALQRSRLVREVRQHLLSLDHRMVSVPELCLRFSVSRRNLQYAFEDVMGMGPNAYLKLLRLNGVRRDLVRHGTGPVQQVAADWGFWHLSQFAKDYRQHFHELPSDTLKRALHLQRS